jgi:fatty-acyl-CoA synthase
VKGSGQDASIAISRQTHSNNLLDRHARMQPNRPAIRFRGRTTTWLTLQERVGRLASALHQRGVGAGDRVGVLMGNRPEYVETFLATNRLGAILVPVNFRLTGAEAAYILDDAGVGIVIVDEIGVPLVADAITRGQFHLEVIAIGTHGLAQTSDYEDLIAAASEVAQSVEVGDHAPALIMYTSGTTGHPKGATLTFNNLHAQSLTILQAFRYEDEREVNLIASPMFHIGALGTVVPSILVGGTMVIMPTGAFNAPETLDLLECEGVTSVFLVPTQWQALCDDASLPDRDLYHLRFLGWGAAPATNSLLRQMTAAFPSARHVAMFGQTEMSPVTCVLHHEDSIRKLGSVGRPIATVTARVVDADMRDVAPGDVGEIIYRGPGLMLGYWNNPAATEEAFTGGWFHSGDLVRVDDEGYVYVVDRVKDMIISGGENIYCAEVENVLAGHPDVADVSVVGQPHEVWGETPVACVVLRPGVEALGIDEMRSWAATALAKYKLPTRLHIFESLPRNASGKVLKPVIRDRISSIDEAGSPSGRQN